MDGTAWLIAGIFALVSATITYLALRLRSVQERASLEQRVREDEAQRWSAVVDGLRAENVEVEGTRRALAERESAVETELAKIAGLDQASAQALYLARFEDSFREAAAQRRQEWEKLAEAEVERIAHERLLTVLSRTASSRVAQATTISVALPNEEMKGRLIGREGRNIRSFEQVTGVDLVIDDTPETVVISSFDPVRREVARLTLMNMMLDGRIHPVRIEELFVKATEEVSRTVAEAGQQAAEQVGVFGLDPAVTTGLGQLRFRSSLAQNVLDHSVETAKLARMLAQEIGFKPDETVRAALLHDIGKGLGEDWDGPHALAGMNFLARHGESEAICHAVGAHHHDVEPESLVATLVIVADSISASRPGARRESLESFIRRVKELESIAKSFQGVAECFALQSGRELRVVVIPDQVDEMAAKQLAFDIARKIEASGDLSGRVKVTVIRETRTTETAT